VLPLQKAEALTEDSWRTKPITNLGPLGWTTSSPPELTLGPGASRTVDLGHTSDADAYVFTLGMPIVPATGVHRLPAGLYEIRLAIFGLNIDAQQWSLRLNYDGLWIGGASADSDTPEHLKITDLRPV
jgi:hypothetical protein